MKLSHLSSFLKNWIKINETSGDVVALQPLNKTAIRKMSLTVLVEDTAASKPKPQLARGMVKPYSLFYIVISRMIIKVYYYIIYN